jgi:hypothetical protein
MAAHGYAADALRIMNSVYPGSVLLGARYGAVDGARMLSSPLPGTRLIGYSGMGATVCSQTCEGLGKIETMGRRHRLPTLT